MTYQRFTLADNRRHEVHAVQGLRTLCGVNLAFAANPAETHARVTCATCLRKLPVADAMTPGSLPLDDDSAALVLAAVRKYGALMRRGADEAASRAYMDVVKLVYGDYARIQPKGLELMEPSAPGEPSPTSAEPLARGTVEAGGAGAPAGAEDLLGRARRLV
jgi:hypothetical protein